MASKTHSVFFALITLCFLTLVGCQDWSQTGQFDAFEGTQLPHVFSDIINIQDGTAIDFTDTYSLTIPEGIFLSTENIYIIPGTFVFILALFSVDFTINPRDRVLFVESAVVNAAKT